MHANVAKVLWHGKARENLYAKPPSLAYHVPQIFPKFEV
jgi:hypothetical protein